MVVRTKKNKKKEKDQQTANKDEGNTGQEDHKAESDGEKAED
jgi:hypothetical protein